MASVYLFDLDGTLVDTEILWVEAMELLAKERGYELTREVALNMVYGISWPEVYERFLNRFPELTMSIEAMGEAINPYFLQLRDSQDVRIPGSIALVKELAKEHTVAVVSGSYRYDVEAGIRIAGIEPYLKFYLGHEDYTPGKPDPACYVAAAKLAGVETAQCVVFEDSWAGVTAAKEAGAFAVALSRPGRPAQDYSQADLILSDLSEFDPSQVKR
ncbi:MAG: HAD family hydrolase [Candidatus Hydrogenedentales bacterium]|jgi:HAD superfamily hydrolase (TIGR01509 family)